MNLKKLWNCMSAKKNEKLKFRPKYKKIKKVEELSSCNDTDNVTVFQLIITGHAHF